MQKSWSRVLLQAIVLACVLVLAGCPKASSKGSALEEAQYTWSAAIRWGNFDGAWSMVDPKEREANPLTDLDFSRYKQVQISSYRDQGERMLGNGNVVRDIEIGVINRNTLAERTVRYREEWRYEPESKTWWLMSGLPNLWQDE